MSTGAEKGSVAVQEIPGEGSVPEDSQAQAPGWGAPRFSLDQAHQSGPRLPSGIPRWTDADFTIDMNKLMAGLGSGKIIGQVEMYSTTCSSISIPSVADGEEGLISLAVRARFAR